MVRALRQRAGVGAPVDVWPPRALPPGILVSPPRYGWVSLWGLTDTCEPLLPELTATLECAGVAFHVEEDAYWALQLYQDGRRTLRLTSPAEVAREMAAYDHAWESLEQEGVDDPGEDEARLRQRAEALLDAGEALDDASDPELLRPLLPAGGSLAEAVGLLRAWDRALEGEGDGEGPAFVEDALETFANYFGIRDAAWDPRHDDETLAAGDYEDPEGLPQDWETFVLLSAVRQDLVTLDE